MEKKKEKKTRDKREGIKREKGRLIGCLKKDPSHIPLGFASNRFSMKQPTRVGAAPGAGDMKANNDILDQLLGGQPQRSPRLSPPAGSTLARIDVVSNVPGRGQEVIKESSEY